MLKVKKLQKVTDFDKIKSVKQIKEFLKKGITKEDKSVIIENVYRRYFDAMDGGDEDESILFEMLTCIIGKTLGHEEEKEFRNKTYEDNHASITSTIHNRTLRDRRFPSISVISRETGLSRTTIYRHLNNGLGAEQSQLQKNKLEYMTISALEALYLIGIETQSNTALKQFIELSGSINGKQSSKITNYIQINNLKISREDFENLPQDVVLEIEKLVSPSVLTNLPSNQNTLEINCQ